MVTWGDHLVGSEADSAACKTIGKISYSVPIEYFRTQRSRSAETTWSCFKKTIELLSTSLEQVL